MHTIRIRDKYQKMTNSTLTKSGKWSTVEEEVEELLDKGLEIMYNGKKSIANKKKALKYFDKALKLDPKMIGVLNHKAFTIDAIVNSKKKSKYTFKDVIFYYDKKIELIL